MKLIKILFALFCLFFSYFSHSLDLIDREHKMRCEKFDINRKDTTLSAHTNRIAGVLVDPNRINYKRLATELEKKRAFKAMMGSVVVHDAALGSLYPIKPFKSAAYEKKYQRHCDAVNQVDAAIRILWGKFNRRESHTFQDILSAMTSKPNLQKFNYEKLLTRNFVDWFYETLEEHLSEQNFFAGRATREWFDNASQLYANNATTKSVFEYTKNKFEIIINSDLKPVAIYKQLRNQSGEAGARNRQIKVEYVSWLIAKTAGLTDVVNPVIPVRKTRAGFVVDPFNYDGSLEPVTATVLKDERGALDVYGRLKDLLSGALNYVGCYSTFTRSYGHFDKETTVVLAPNLSTYSTYFTSSYPSGAHRFSFLDYFRGVEDKKKIADLRSFRDAVSLKHLWDVVVFWYLTLQEDMNPSNILYIPNQSGGIVPQVIDYDIALGKDAGIGKRIPLVYAFPQANQPLQTGFFNTLVRLSDRKLTRIIETYKRTVRVDGASELAADTPEKLIERLRTLQQMASPAKPQTLKQAMLELIGRRQYSYPEYFSLFSKASCLVGATILDPLKFGQFRLNRPTKHAETLGEISVNRKDVMVYRLPWILAVNEEEQLDGFWDKGYIPLEEIHTLCEKMFESSRC